MRHGEIVISRNGENVVITLVGLQTETRKERLGGLLIRNKLQKKEALWITHCSSIHTFGMKYNLDLMYINKNDEICGLSRHMKPWRMSFCYNAKATVELLAGNISLFGIREGDKCIWQD